MPSRITFGEFNPLYTYHAVPVLAVLVYLHKHTVRSQFLPFLKLLLQVLLQFRKPIPKPPATAPASKISL